ncbi:MAG: hypothetical protein LVQ63_00775 [Thermoplasmatales archaeon]|nr:hypothetical protein [Thermoplasmatales archaeon]
MVKTYALANSSFGTFLPERYSLSAPAASSGRFVCLFFCPFPLTLIMPFWKSISDTLRSVSSWSLTPVPNRT